MSDAPIRLRGAGVRLRLVAPPAPGIGALNLVEQMTRAIEAGEVIVPPWNRAAVDAWLAAARAELEREAVGR
jgi:hypothetical protein